MSRRPRPHASRFAQAPEARPTPEPPPGFSEAATEVWRYVWQHSWIKPDRHRLTVERYCRIQGLLRDAFDVVARDGLLSEGSHKQLRTHPGMAEIRLLSTESRLIEAELGLTPAAESKAGVPPIQTTDALADMIAERRRPNDKRDDFRVGLGLVSVTGAESRNAGPSASVTTCDGCGEQFKGRARARYCSPACRQRAFRERQSS